jgi:hypothetical protein
MDGGGRAVSGTKAENNAGSSYRASAAKSLRTGVLTFAAASAAQANRNRSRRLLQ